MQKLKTIVLCCTFVRSSKFWRSTAINNDQQSEHKQLFSRKTNIATLYLFAIRPQDNMLHSIFFLTSRYFEIYLGEMNLGIQYP